MASEDPSRRASVASTTSDASLLDQTNVVKAIIKKDKPNGSVKLKKAIVKNSKPKVEGEVGEAVESKIGGTTRSPTPDSPIPEAELGKPIEDRPDHIQCKHCKRPTPKAVAQSHVRLCEQKKKEKARKKKEAKEAKAALAREKEKAEKEKEADEAAEDPAAAIRPTEDGADPSGVGDDKTKIGKKSAGKAAPDGPKTTKKRKADGDGDKEPKKKKLKKDEPPKPKLPKPKGPVDVEKQCGVLLPNGGYCARSLTCKSHSMGAKRAVPGRSLPYDILLASYQKKNQAKQQSKLLLSFPLFGFSLSFHLDTRHIITISYSEKTPVKPRKTIDSKSGGSDLTPATAPGARMAKRKPEVRAQAASIRHGKPHHPRKTNAAAVPTYKTKNHPTTNKKPVTTKAAEAALSSLAPIPDDLEPTGPIDSDEETEAVMAGIRRSRPQPLAQHYHIDTRRRYEVIRRKEALRQALIGPNGSRLFAVGPPVVQTASSGPTGANTQPIPGGNGNEDGDGNMEDWPDGPTDGAPMRKASVASVKSAAAGPSRKASIA